MSLTESAFNFLCVEIEKDDTFYVNPYFLSVYSTLFKTLLETDNNHILRVRNIKLRGTLNDWKMLMNDFARYFERLYCDDTEQETNLARLMAGAVCSKEFEVSYSNYTDYLIFLDYLGLDQNFVADIFSDWFYDIIETKTEIDYSELTKIPANLHDRLCFLTLDIKYGPNGTLNHYLRYKYYKILKTVNPKKAAQLNDDLLMLQYESEKFIQRLKAESDKMPYNIIFE